MPALTHYHLFISHAWKYDEDYDRLENLLIGVLVNVSGWK